MDHHTAGTDAAHFYDAIRRTGPSSAALAHGNDFVGQECVLTPQEMLTFARRAGITAATTVLDIGSGTGGPACYLAQQLGCQVLGVDVSSIGHTQAIDRARAAGLSHLVQFQCSDIHAITLPTAAFDVILSLDSLCHVPQRAVLLQRCATWLRPGGRVAFYDHVECQSLPPEERQRFYTLWRFPGLESPQSYFHALHAARLQRRYAEVTSTYAVRFYTLLLQCYQEQRATMEARRGPERYQEGLQRLQMSQRFAAAGVLGQLACIAEKPIPKVS